MTLPQFGIFAQGTVAHEFLEFELRPDVDLSAVGAVLERLRMPAVAAGGVNIVLGFGADLWRAIDPDDAPEDLAPFQPLGVLGGHHAPASQHDLWLWINGARSFDAACRSEARRDRGEPPDDVDRRPRRTACAALQDGFDSRGPRRAAARPRGIRGDRAVGRCPTGPSWGRLAQEERAWKARRAATDGLFGTPAGPR